MKNSNVKTNVSKENFKKIKEAKAKGKLDQLNLDNLTNSLGISEEEIKKIKSSTSKRKGNHIYNIDYDSLSTDEQKRHRNLMRNKLKGFVNNIIGKDRSEKEKQIFIIEFLKFYKKEYRINNFEISSLRNKISNQRDKEDLQLMLDNVKNFLTENNIEF